MTEFEDLVVLVEEGESWRGGEARRFFSPNCESTRLRFFDPAVDGADIVLCFFFPLNPVSVMAIYNNNRVFCLFFCLFSSFKYCTWYLWAKKKWKVSKMTRLTPELVTELFCPTLISCENPNVNGAVEKILENFRAKCLTKKHEKSLRFCV